MRYHWFARSSEGTLEGLRKTSNKIDEVGYYSALFVYHSRIPDYWIKIANIINKSHKFKYMIAIRTYAISPEYLYMMSEAFEEIAPDRLMFNILSGDIQSDETSIQDLVFIEDMLESSNKRFIYTKEWLKKLNNLTQNFKKKPEIVIAGHSIGLRELADLYGYTQATSLDSFDRYFKNNDNMFSKKQMMSLAVIVRDSYDEAKIFWESLTKNEKCFSIYGDKNSIIKQFKDFEKMGMTDLLVCSLPDDELSSDKIHDIIKELVGGQNGIS